MDKGGRNRNQFQRRLRRRAEDVVAAGRNQITGGTGIEQPVDSFMWRGMRVVRMPDDPDTVLRVSLGGGSHLPVRGDYCVFRGEADAIEGLLFQALGALKEWRSRTEK